jgi:hypothetical protein
VRHNGVEKQNIGPDLPHLDQRARRISRDLHFQTGSSEVLGEPESGDQVAINHLNAQFV